MTNQDPVQILSTTSKTSAGLVVWLGGCDTPFAYWPNDDRDACLEAVREWVRREQSIFTAQDLDDGTEDEEARVERYMSSISIEVAS